MVSPLFCRNCRFAYVTPRLLRIEGDCMKHVLALVGSPRRGNTLAAVEAISRVLKEEEEMDVEFIHLSDSKIGMCRGCFACLKKGIENCPIDDELPDILHRMMMADGIIFASPVYVMSVSGLMKNFFDRLASICHRPIFCDKYAMVVATVGAIGLSDTLKYMSSAVGSWQFRKVIQLGIKTPLAFDYQENLSGRNSSIIIRQSRKFKTMILQGKYVSPGLMQVIQFRIQRAIFTGRASSDWPADREFYSSLKGRKFYCDVKVNPVFSFLGYLAERLVSLMMK
jgi:multimeric flavodoxin WrbA